jgi:hypothetical protein
MPDSGLNKSWRRAYGSRLKLKAKKYKYCGCAAFK